MGTKHPISWCHDYDGGRAWYTGAGHAPESYRGELFLDHLLGGIKAAGATELACGGAGSRRSSPGNATSSNG